MSGVLNDCDALLQAAGVRILNGKGAYINLALSAPGFHLNSAGVADLSVVSVKADMVGLTGSVNFSAQGGTLSNASANGVDVTYTGSAAVVTATVVSGGETVTRSIAVPVLRDGAAGSNGSNGTNGTNGTNGVSPPKNAVAFLYKWSTAAPSKPAGTTTFTWAAAANTAYSGNDGWAIAPPANPGTPLIQLFVASIAVSDVAAATSTTVGYTSSIVAAWAQNGANGSNGSNGTNGATGVQSGEAKVYQWAATIPAGPAGSPSFVWATSAFGAAPTNWTLTPGAAPSPGMTLWMARVGVTDSAAATSTAFNWTAASILAVGYAGANGSNGSNGGNGAEGASYVTAYCASSTASTTTAPSVTSGKSSVPASNGGGIVGAWTKAVPVLASGQFLYQSDGIYDPATGNVTWSIPYWSSLKVGTLSAITANLGAITGGSIDIGAGGTSWHVDAQGNMWIGAAAFASAPYRVSNTGAVTAQSFRTEGATGNTLFEVVGGVATLYDGAGGVVLRSGQSLAQQAMVGPNLIPRLSSWPSLYNAAIGYSPGDGALINGEYLYLGSAASGYVGAETASVGIRQNGTITVSFDAYCQGVARDLAVDFYGPNVDSTGLVVTLSNTIRRYTFTETLTHADAPLARLRMFAPQVTVGSAIIVFNVKVEVGIKATPWCDNVITPVNVAQYVMPSSIGNTQIGGDLYSTNWNGGTDKYGAGWLMSRSGILYCNDVRARGTVSGGDFTPAYAWPAGGGTGFHLGPSGLLLGNPNIGKYFQVAADGNIYAPGFKLENGQLTLTNTILISPQIAKIAGSFVSSPANSYYFTAGAYNANAFAGAYEVNLTSPDGTETFAFSASCDNTAIGVRIGGVVGKRGNLYVAGNGYFGEVTVTLSCSVNRGGISSIFTVQTVVSFQ